MRQSAAPIFCGNGEGPGRDQKTKSLFENYTRCCGEGFWLWPRRRGRSIPAAGGNDRANAGHGQKTRRPEGFQQKAVWLRCFSVEDPRGIWGFPSPAIQIPERECALARKAVSFVAPRHPAFCWKTASPGSFQTGSKNGNASHIGGLRNRVICGKSCLIISSTC